MSEAPLEEIKRKMVEHYKSLTKGLFFEKFLEGKIIHMTIKHGGPFEIWFEDPNRNDKYTPGKK